MKIKEDKISIINRSSKVEGYLKVKGHLIVEGAIDGSVDAESMYTEKESHLTAKVHADFLNIAGFFEGEIEAGTLTLLKTADVKGNIQCQKLIVDEGAVLNGSVKFIADDRSQQHTD